MTSEELGEKLTLICKHIESDLRFLESIAIERAEAERHYREDKGNRWLHHESGSVAERQAVIDGETAQLRYERDVAEVKERTTKERIRAREAELSALQTLSRLQTAEAEFSRTGPEGS